MKRYQTCPGVVLTTVGGQNVLVAAKEAREKCPYITQINETAAFCWRILERGATLQSLCDAICAEYEIEDADTLASDLTELIEQLTQANYLFEELE